MEVIVDAVAVSSWDFHEIHVGFRRGSRALGQAPESAGTLKGLHVFAKRTIRFGAYHLHPTQGLKRDQEELRVTPKSLAVLGVLLERSGEVVTRAELFGSIWADTTVSESALATCIQELRRVLGDDARHPKYIETVHRRGFRFRASAAAGEVAPRTPGPRGLTAAAQPSIVGRDDALLELSRLFSQARGGQRQLLLVSGEPGIGKTALVDTWLTGMQDRQACSVARGACVEHHGAGEAYQPLIEALGRLASGPDGEACVAALEQYGPSWLAELPLHGPPAERQRLLARRAAGATPERMLRELTLTFEALSQAAPVVLCLEDLHWSDVATLDWLVSFARRPEPAAVLVIGTYRPGEAFKAARSPDAVASELSLKGLCAEMALARLDAPSVSDYVLARFPPAAGARASLEKLAGLVYQRTEGNPLFLVNASSDLTARGVLKEGPDGWAVPDDLDAGSLAIPRDIRRAIEHQLDRQGDEERRLLEVASLVKGTCSAAAVAAGAGISTSEVEAKLGALARRDCFLHAGPAVEWPDGTVSATFEFLHSLYREVISSRPSPARRAELHRAIGARLEAAYGERARELCAELALHFELGRDLPRAVKYLEQAADTARGRSAHDVARQHYARALSLLEKLPAGAERDAREVALRVGLGSVLMQTSGWGAPAVEAQYTRVRELSETHGGPALFPALYNLWLFYTARGDLGEARAAAERLLSLATQSGAPEALLQAHHAHWSTLFALGDLRGAELHVRQGLELCERVGRATLAYGSHDTGICARMFRARVLALSGRVDTAALVCEEALTLARELEHPFTLAFTLMHVAAVHETRRDAARAHTCAAEATLVADEYGFGLMRGWSSSLLGWSMAQRGETGQGVARLREGVASACSTGSLLFQPHLLGLVASGQAAHGLIAEALETLADALTLGARTGERFYAAELHRLRGQLRLALDDDVGARQNAEDDFRTARQLAEEQGAWQLALRASVSLARLHQQNGASDEALRLLLEARARLTEGAKLPDIAEADALLLEARARFSGT